MACNKKIFLNNFKQGQEVFNVTARVNVNVNQELLVINVTAVLQTFIILIQLDVLLAIAVKEDHWVMNQVVILFLVLVLVRKTLRVNAVESKYYIESILSKPYFYKN